MKNNRILWVFSHYTYLERYAELVTNLKRRQIDVKILLSVNELDSNINTITSNYSNLNITIFKHNQKLYFWEQILNYSRIKNNLNLSISFYERFKFIVLTFRSMSSNFLNDMKRKGLRITIKQIPNKYKFHLFVHFVGIKFFHKLLHFLAYKFFIRDSCLTKLIKDQPEDLVFFTYQGPHAETNLLIKICKKFNKKIIFLQHNWDNLSSKELLFLKPDILGVWSYQCMIHAVTIQKMPENNVRILGNYLIDQHLKSPERNHYGDKGYILFLGDSTNMDEYKILGIISAYLEIFNKSTTKKLYCFYRPHPYINKKRYQEENLPKYIRIDPDYEDLYFQRIQKTKDLFFTDVKYLSSAIEFSEWVISGGTTAFVEACLHEKKVLLIDAPIRTVSILSKTHFHGVIGMEGVTVVNQELFSISSMELFIEKSQNATLLDDPKLKYYYENRSATSFIDNLCSIITELQA